MFDAADHPLRICKLGGSLLAEPQLAVWFRAWWVRQLPLRTVVISGGGTRVDAIEKTTGISDEDAHWRCIEAMGENTRLLSGLFPEAPWSEQLAELTHWQFPLASWVLFDAGPYLRENDRQHPDGRLPMNWDVTSDSIAARLAQVLGAEELVLLKSAVPKSNCTIRQASATGYVDRFFPLAAARLARIRCVNLREPNEEILLRRELIPPPLG